MTIQAIEDGNWQCLCRNVPSSDGFFPCDSDGDIVPPTKELWKTGWYVCDRCGLIIDEHTLEVVGSRVADPDDAYRNQLYDYEAENNKPCPVCHTVIDYHFHGFIHYPRENVWVCTHHSVEETVTVLRRPLTKCERIWIEW